MLKFQIIFSPCLVQNEAVLLGKKEMENKMVIVIWRGPSGAYRKARENELAVV